MSRGMDVFIASEDTLEDLVKNLELLLKLSARRFSEDGEIWYELQDDQTLFSVGTHEYINNKGINFEDYQYDVEVSAINIKDVRERMKHLEDAAYFIFNQLKNTHKYSILLVDDLQSKVAESYH